ncbi:uncharacterized protein PV09_07078 [Verruconis gallopava]|uniref:Uncharacterized protein n=1 Tax=Verruconis gallopava TaxID=253628 RepID=A0A0D1XHB2_9PEZI|nr:uncharacterized protein PV09_07078 [Verruconis gallopava]KIW01606.1 hypothetical protein PV09_07078 [Verruconis gallopava]
MSQNTGKAFNALIRTHHITSKKKIAKLRHAAHVHNVYAILHSGKCPGIMYCEGSEAGVKSWVSNVQGLRYKDYHLVARPAEAQLTPSADDSSTRGKLVEVSSVASFAGHMESRSILAWWRKAMNYTP